MKVKFLRLWRGTPEGAIRERADGAANLLIARGVCKSMERKPRAKKNGSSKRNSK